ncbi:hypothetical protein ACIBK8_32990 [Streptomyces sp. NPDC050161]|uniref:hypothetical protein n=1 Tax=Streptomyces sp. NPDC050161 TaxID=3365604 RepID=UPI0037B9C466
MHISHARGYLTADNGPPRCDLPEEDVRYLRLIAAGETMNTHARRYGLLKRMGAKNSPHAVHLGWCWNYLNAGP